MTDDWRNQTLADLSKQTDKGASVIDRLPIHVIDEGGLDGGTHYWVHLYGVGRRTFGGTSKDEGFGITTHPGEHNPWKYDHFPTINAAIWAIRSRSVVNSVRVFVPRKPRKRPKTSRKLPARRRRTVAHLTDRKKNQMHPVTVVGLFTTGLVLIILAIVWVS